MKKWLILTWIISFVMGWYFGTEVSEHDFPEYAYIRRDGKPLAYAITTPESAMIVNMKEGPNPGIYLSFPVYSDRNSVDRMVS